MKTWLLTGLEIALLFGALAFTLTPLPSHEVARLPFLPAGALAIALFGASRALRWHRHSYLIAIPETAAFALFAWVSHEIATKLLAL